MPLAFGIMHPLMAFWLAAAAAPIVIHLLSRRKYREMSWAAMEFLLAAVRQRPRKGEFVVLVGGGASVARPSP